MSDNPRTVDDGAQTTYSTFERLNVSTPAQRELFNRFAEPRSQQVVFSVVVTDTSNPFPR